MTIKISTGKFKGKTIASTNLARELRPSQSIVREAFISILKNLIVFEETNALDLYSGIGSMSMELISNDIKSVDFVEKDPRCLIALRKNLKMLNFESKARVIKGDVAKQLKNFSKNYQLIFMDPPYEIPLKTLKKNLDILVQKNLVENHGMLVIESDREDLPKAFDQENYQEFKLLKSKKYGDSLLFFYKIEKNFSKNTL